MSKIIRFVFTLILLNGAACGKSEEKTTFHPEPEWEPRLLEKLGLNADQKKRLVQDFQINKKNFLLQTRKIRQIKQELKSVLYVYPVDKSRVKSLKAKWIVAKTEMAEMQVNSSLNLLAQLDKNQHALFVKLSEERISGLKHKQASQGEK